MASVLITENTCNSVRLALDLSLTEEMVPDSVILDDTYAGNAERAIRDLVTDIDTRSASELGRLQAAMVYYTAANIVYSLPRIISEHFGQTYQYQSKAVDQVEARALLLAKGAAEVQAVLNPTTIPPGLRLRPTLFVNAPGFRGRL